jgi:hypothetical protein
MASILQYYHHFGADSHYLVSSSAFVGAAFHVAIAALDIEFERYIFHSLTLTILLFFCDFVAAIRLGNYSYLDALIHPCIIALGFSVGAAISISVYRIFVHRCARFPGPPMAKFTQFYAAYLNSRETQFYRELEMLHGKYGDYVRMGKSRPDRLK